MRSSAEPGLQVTVLDSIDAAPPECATLLAAAAAQSFFLTRTWFQATEAAGLAAGTMPRFLLISRAARPAALLPLMTAAGEDTLQGLSTVYSCLFAPLIDPAETPAGVVQIGMALARQVRRFPTVRLDAMPADATWLAPLQSGLRAGGMVSSRFDHFGNWYAPVQGMAWSGYLAARPGALREVIRRKLPRVMRDLQWTVLAAPSEIEPGIAAFEAVLRQSWKDPEPQPAFNATVMRHAAAVGVLRLGLLHRNGHPVAAQLWVVSGSTATVLKLVHDEAFKSYSPGSVLTALMIRRLMEHEAVAELDFGRGDDRYKPDWAPVRRQRIGLVLANPLHPAGLAFLGRHQLGRGRRQIAAWFTASREGASSAHRP